LIVSGVEALFSLKQVIDCARGRQRLSDHRDNRKEYNPTEDGAETHDVTYEAAMLSDSVMRCISSGGANAETMLGVFAKARQEFYLQITQIS